jgi:head-tail adaptor
MPSVPAGRRSTFVELQRSTDGRDPKTNARIKTWTKVSEAWVSFLPMRGTEDYVDEARIGQVVIRLEGDAFDLAEARNEDRILDVDTGRIIDIKAVLPSPDFRDKIRIEGTQGEGAR